MTANAVAMKAIKENLEELCKQLPDGANCNPAARILSIINKLKAEADVRLGKTCGCVLPDHKPVCPDSQSADVQEIIITNSSDHPVTIELPRSETITLPVDARGDDIRELAQRIMNEGHSSADESLEEYKVRLERCVGYLTAFASRPVHGWLDISTAPKDGTRILVTTKSDHIMIVWYEENFGMNGWVSYPGAYGCEPTHWQPLPTPPHGGGG